MTEALEVFRKLFNIPLNGNASSDTNDDYGVSAEDSKEREVMSFDQRQDEFVQELSGSSDPHSLEYSPKKTENNTSKEADSVPKEPSKVIEEVCSGDISDEVHEVIEEFDNLAQEQEAKKIQKKQKKKEKAMETFDDLFEAANNRAENGGVAVAVDSDWPDSPKGDLAEKSKKEEEPIVQEETAPMTVDEFSDVFEGATEDEVVTQEKSKEQTVESSEDGFLDSQAPEPEQKSEPEKTIKQEDTTTERPTEERNLVSKNDVIMLDGEIQWILDEPTPNYTGFYGHKREIVKNIVGGKQIPYDRWIDELAKSHVNVTLQVYDPNVIHDRMQIVQNLRNRVCHILMVCNSQYYLFERAIELLRGTLARVEYISPAIKQSGVIYQHMRDIEFYFARLKTVHRSGDMILKNLDAAFEVLSRKLTISIPTWQQQRAEQQAPKQAISQELEAFDDLPKDAKSQHDSKKTGKIDWSD